MKKLSVLFLSVVALATTVTSCSKNDKATPTTSLELTVQNYDTTTPVVVSNATVDLYASQNDYQNQQNKVGTMTSDVNGKVLFDNLKNIQYYFDVNKDCQSNIFTAPTNGNALVSGQKNTFTVPVVSTGKVSVTNNSANDWDITILTNSNPISLYTIPANKSGNALMPAGSYTIRMVEYLPNSNTTTGNTKDFPVTVTCGQVSTDTVVVP